MAFSAACMALLSHVFVLLFYVNFNLHRISPPFTPALFLFRTLGKLCVRCQSDLGGAYHRSVARTNLCRNHVKLSWVKTWSPSSNQGRRVVPRIQKIPTDSRGPAENTAPFFRRNGLIREIDGTVMDNYWYHWRQCISSICQGIPPKAEKILKWHVSAYLFQIV